MTQHEPKDVLRYALKQALKAVDRNDWDDLLGQLDVAQHTVKDAIAYANEWDVPGLTLCVDCGRNLVAGSCPVCEEPS